MFSIFLGVLLAIAVPHKQKNPSPPPTPKISFTWAVELTYTGTDGKEATRYYFNGDPGMLRIAGPEDLLCGFKVDELRVAPHPSGDTVFFQNAFIGCMTGDGYMMNTGATVGFLGGVTQERDTNLIYGKNNEFSARLIPCVGKFKGQCEEWSRK